MFTHLLTNAGKIFTLRFSAHAERHSTVAPIDLTIANTAEGMILKMRENMTSHYRTIRRVLSLFIAACLVLGMPLMSVFAAEYGYPEAAPRGDEPDELTASGSSGGMIAFAEIDGAISVSPGVMRLAATHTWDSAAPPTGLQDGDTVTISGAPSGELVIPGGMTITVQGSVTQATQELDLNISANSTVKWGADYWGTAARALINFTGDGTLEVGSGGYIYNTGGGNAILASGAKVVVSGDNSMSGTVQSVTGSAIRGAGPNTTVTVEGSGSVMNDATANLNPVINMTDVTNTGDNVFVTGNGHVWALSETGLDYAIQTFGNVVVSGGDIYSAAVNGRAINLVGLNSTAKISGGKVHADGQNGVAISTATTGLPSPGETVANASAEITGGDVTASSYAIRMRGNSSHVIVGGGTVSSTADDAIYATGASADIEVSGGVVSATDGDAIHTTQQGANVTVSGGVVSATNGYAIHTTQQGANVTVSGGFVFAYGTGIGGVVNKPGFAPGGTGIVAAWQETESPYVYAKGHDSHLISLPDPAGTVTWDSDTALGGGIRYKNGANQG
ncbi:MAG: hypothetical protein LBH86_01020, partial [Oscillospiraceae bacterium]|nr:hypothetical protein [Oscillospiraceae bacterium]